MSLLVLAYVHNQYVAKYQNILNLSVICFLTLHEETCVALFAETALPELTVYEDYN